MTRAASFRKADLDKALRCAQEAGLSVSGIEFDENGFKLQFGADNDKDTSASKALEGWLKGNENHH